MPKISLDDVLAMAPPDKKKKIRDMAEGKTGVYCVAAKKKVKLSSTHFELRHQKNGRTVVSIVGTGPQCKTADGKASTARSYVLNVASKGVKAHRQKSPRRKSRRKSKSPKRRRKSRRRSRKSRSRSRSRSK